jgi:hypothetical protein
LFIFLSSGKPKVARGLEGDAGLPKCKDTEKNDRAKTFLGKNNTFAGLLPDAARETHPHPTCKNGVPTAMQRTRPTFRQDRENGWQTEVSASVKKETERA